MKKTILLLTAVFLLTLLCVSCAEEETVVITNQVLSPFWAILERSNDTTKMHLAILQHQSHSPYNGAVRLCIWTKGVEQTEFADNPDVIFDGEYSVKKYTTLDEESKSLIVYTEHECGIVNFTSVTVPDGTEDFVKVNYEQQMALFSGAFDFEYVSGYKTEENRNGGITKSYGKRGFGKQVVNLTVTQHPEHDTDQALIISEGWRDSGYTVLDNIDN